jgi:hypothetical protein
MPQAPDRKRDLDLPVAIAVSVGRKGSWFYWRGRYFRFVRIQAGMAPTAKVVVGPELDQETAITSHHFP